MSLDWHQQLDKALAEKYGQKKSAELSEKYKDSFQINYTLENSIAMAMDDMACMEKLNTSNPLDINFYTNVENGQPVLHLRLFQWGKSIPLSDILPMLENMDLRVDRETPFKINITAEDVVWISDFIVIYKKGVLTLEPLERLFNEAFSKIYFGTAENDGFNKLILGVGLSWREITILRAYAKYLRQVGFRFSQSYIERALSAHTVITRDLINLFFSLHNPAKTGKKNDADAIEAKIIKSLDSVSSLDEDRILRRLLELIKETLRTNYFQLGADDLPKSYLALKLNSRSLSEMPLPIPLYEVFIYSPRFEGIHLRNAKVARGGIRWSTRLEDFRTEILGLMKAQTVKNAVIVPSGAKGGFVLKTNIEISNREVLQGEVAACYTLFICGLLDLTDNIVNNKIIRPKQVVCHDDNDPYLVVAADKGTATFSDLANSISKDYAFWMGDAFASGGSAGYDHKKMGITARGAWESIKRHFRELNINAVTSPITVVGIGDMSGDVFGNGMLYSKKLRLLAAFDHRDIFIDPNPDSAISYKERLRLFKLPGSSWQDYNPELISQGGGVFKRTLKSIKITKAMKQVLAIDDDELTPNDLIKAVLKAPVDLLYNGGIGTYVKASYEINAVVGDRTNDYTRVDGRDLRCRVVGEGGNLGFTQLGRIEYAMQGGLINTDFIDNSAGVDCSDHEVNLKILLYSEIDKGKLTLEKRNELLESLTDEVATLVLQDNYHQALILSYSAYRAPKLISLHGDYIRELESNGFLNRVVEFLPDDKELLERKAANMALSRPELAVLLEYTKIYLKQEILKTDIPEDPFLSKCSQSAFPPSICKKYHVIMQDHRLRRDLIATQLSNQLVNEMGITFVYRLQQETGAKVDEIVRAHAIASRIYGTAELQKLIESLDYKIPLNEQYDMLYNLRNLINLTTRWFLHHTKQIKGNLENLIDHFSVRIEKLEGLIPELMSGYTKEYLDTLTKKFLATGLPTETAHRIATYRAIYTALNVIDVATIHNFDLDKTARVYFAGGERINLVWFRDQIATDAREGHWNALARLTLRDELDISQRALTVAIMRYNKKGLDANALIDHWMAENSRALERWRSLLSSLTGSTNIDYTMFFIALRELWALLASS